MNKSINLMSWIFLLFAQTVSCQIYNDSNKIACLRLEKQLLEIKEYVEDIDIQMNGVANAVDFFEDLTGIESESGGTYLGKLNPSKKDFLAWNNWYDINREKLWIDSKSGKVIVSK